jgi:hypothetical protein
VPRNVKRTAGYTQVAGRRTVHVDIEIIDLRRSVTVCSSAAWLPSLPAGLGKAIMVD